jgi:hypothetical protein
MEFLSCTQHALTIVGTLGLGVFCARQSTTCLEGNSRQSRRVVFSSLAFHVNDSSDYENEESEEYGKNAAQDEKPNQWVCEAD